MRIKIFFGKGLVPLLFSFLLMILCLAGCAENSSILDNGQSRQLAFSVTTHNWSDSADSNKSSNQKVPSRSTPINTFDTSKNFNVITDVNKGGNWNTEINNETASYSSTNNIWQTTATTHYWPGTGCTVNFYAYYPTSISGSITHNTGSAPVLSYTVPDDVADQIDILASSKTGVAGDSYSQTPVDFKHILAAVKFSVGTSGLPGGTITKITLNNIQYKGTYSFDGTWTPNTTDLKSFSQTVSASTNASTTITSGPTTFMMIPQTLNKDAGITATYSTGTSYTAKISGPWSAGDSYTYNLNKSETAVAAQYLFSDGTWGSYDPAKTVIGIVFSNTTSSTDKSHGWTHGYAMALQNAGSGTATYQWYTSDSGNPTGTYITGTDNIMSDKDGYSHSGYLQTSGYSAGIAARDYTAKDKNGNTIAAPSNTSGWYLPSCGQWYDILASLGGMVAASGKAYTYTNNSDYLRWYGGDTSGDTHNYSSLCASNLNVYLNGLKSNGYSIDLFSNSNELYWSSSEYNSFWAYCVDFYSTGAMRLDDADKTGSFRVRPVLAF